MKKKINCACCGTTIINQEDQKVVQVEGMTFCWGCATKLWTGLTKALNDRSLKHGDKGWFANPDEGILEPARVDVPVYKNGELFSFGLDFAKSEQEAEAGRYEDYDVFNGDCFQKHFFLEREAAEAALWIAMDHDPN